MLREYYTTKPIALVQLFCNWMDAASLIIIYIKHIGKDFSFVGTSGSGVQPSRLMSSSAEISSPPLFVPEMPSLSLGTGRYLLWNLQNTS